MYLKERVVFRRLAIRIALLIIIVGPVLLFSTGMIALLYQSIGHSGGATRLFVLLMLGVLTPIIIGILAARQITEPIKRLEDAVGMLTRNRGKVTLPPAEIKEFDTIVAQVNILSEQLAREEDLRKHLISDTAHELNTPLTILIGQLESMRAGLIKKDTAHIELLLEQTQRLNKLAQGLLEYARVQSSAFRVSPKSLQLHKVFNKLYLLYQKELQQRDMALSLVGGVDSLVADPQLFEQILTNLIENAIRYSQGTAIEVSFDGTQLAVSDNGVGVPEKHLDDLFERFFRVDQARTQGSGGLGLGLAIVYEIVASHSWTIEARNTNPGLKFIITM